MIVLTTKQPRQADMNKRQYPNLIGRELLGKRLKWARERAKMTQADLAISVGVSQQAIAKIEDGQTKDPRRKSIMAIAEKLDISPGWLAFGLEELDTLDAEAIEIAKIWSMLPDDEKEAYRLLLMKRHAKTVE